MKTLRIFAFAAIALIMTACGKSNEELIVGTWNEHETGTTVVIYNADHSYHVDYEGGDKEDGTWRIEGTTLYLKESGSDEELDSEIGTLDEETLTEVIGGMFQTTYKRAK